MPLRISMRERRGKRDGIDDVTTPERGCDVAKCDQAKKSERGQF